MEIDHAPEALGDLRICDAVFRDGRELVHHRGGLLLRGDCRPGAGIAGRPDSRLC